MFIISIAPLSAIPRPSDQILDYFSPGRVAPGQYVQISLGRRIIGGIVFACKDAEVLRMAIKASPYPLKSVKQILSDAPLLDELERAFAQWLSEYYYTPLGLVLQRMIPVFYARRGKPFSLSFAHNINAEGTERSERAHRERFGTLIVEEKRAEQYRDFFAHKGIERSLLLVPERNDIEEWKHSNILENAGMLEFHAGLGKKMQREVWEKMRMGQDSRFVVGTRSAMLLAPSVFDAIAIERVHDSSHTSWDQNPHINNVRASLWLHDTWGTALAIGADTPGIETHYWAKARGWNSIHQELPHAPNASIIDMRAELKAGNRSLLSKELKEALAGVLQNKKQAPLRQGFDGQAFLFINRRGFSSGILCRDCGHVVTCDNCSVPMVYHAASRGRILTCHHCGAQKVPPNICPQCRGTRIKYIGGGTQRVQEEVQRLYPAAKVCRLDSDTAKDEQGAEHIFSAFCRGDYQIMVGTQFALKFFPTTELLPLSALVMGDSLLNLPDFRSQERMYEIITRLRGMTRQCIVQTYRAQLPLFTQAAEGNWDAFEQEELMLRKIMNWPPFCQIVKLSYAHKDRARAEEEAKILKNKLELQIKHLARNKEQDASKLILGPAPAFVEKVGGTYIWYLIIKWPVNEKGDPRNLVLRNRLLDLAGKDWNIDVDPIDLV